MAEAIVFQGLEVLIQETVSLVEEIEVKAGTGGVIIRAVFGGALV